MRPIITDCNNMCHIQRHAFGDDLSYQDELTGIMWGFLRMLLELSKQFETHRFLFCWDSRKSYRKMEYPEYKANRQQEKTAGELEDNARIYEQFNKLQKEVLPAIGFRNIYHHTGWEADDIIAIVLRDLVVGIAMGDLNGPPIIVSTDKDMYQLLDHCVIYRPLPGDQKMVMTYKLFRERYGVVPQQWVHVRALEGDVSDNIPGIKGVGSKSAIKFIQGQLKPGKVRTAITHADSQKTIKRNVRLMSLPYVGLPMAPAKDHVGMFPIEANETLSFDAFIRVCEKYDFGSFLKTKKLEEWRKHFGMVV